jgi:hypothetical protein
VCVCVCVCVCVYMLLTRLRHAPQGTKFTKVTSIEPYFMVNIVYGMPYFMVNMYCTWPYFMEHGIWPLLYSKYNDNIALFHGKYVWYIDLFSGPLGSEKRSRMTPPGSRTLWTMVYGYYFVVNI